MPAGANRPTFPPIPLPRPRRLLRRARRSPIAWWACSAVVAILAAGQVAALDDAAEARRRDWGEDVEVVVAARDLAPGDVVGEGDVIVERWPRRMVPSEALHDVPTSRTVSAPIVAGEAIVASRVAPEGLSVLAALIPDGHRAVAVPAAGDGFGTGAPPRSVADRVDVLATFDILDGPSEPTGVIAEGALVVDVGEATVTVAVPQRDVSRVAYAAARGTVTLALVGA